MEPEYGSCLVESSLPSFAFPGKCPHLFLHSRSSHRELYHQTLLSALRACPKPASWSSWFCMTKTFPSLRTKLLLPEWPRSTEAPAFPHTAASLLSVHVPKQHHPSPLLQHETQLCVPSSLHLRMQLPYLSPALHSTGTSIHNASLLFEGMQVLQPCFINIPVSS